MIAFAFHLFGECLRYVFFPYSDLTFSRTNVMRTQKLLLFLRDSMSMQISTQTHFGTGTVTPVQIKMIMYKILPYVLRMCVIAKKKKQFRMRLRHLSFSMNTNRNTICYQLKPTVCACILFSLLKNYVYVIIINHGRTYIHR